MEAYADAVPTWESGAAHKSQDTGIFRFMQSTDTLLQWIIVDDLHYKTIAIALLILSHI